MAVQGAGPADFIKLAKFAWTVYANLRDSRENFGRLHLDAESLLVSIGSLDKGCTRQLIGEYIDGDNFDKTGGPDAELRLHEVRALRDGLNSVVMPFYALFEDHRPLFGPGPGSGTGTTGGKRGLPPLDKSGINIYTTSPTTTYDPSRPTTKRDRPWKSWALTSWITRLKISFELKDLDELRSRFALQAANLNLFMTRLTHSQLARQSEMMMLRVSEETLLSGNWRYSRDLETGGQKFRRDVGRYIKFLVDGGMAFDGDELRGRLVEQQQQIGMRKKIITAGYEKEYLRKEEEQESRYDNSRTRARKSEWDELHERHVGPSYDNGGVYSDLDEDARAKLEDAAARLAKATAQGLIDDDDAITTTRREYEIPISTTTKPKYQTTPHPRTKPPISRRQTAPIIERPPISSRPSTTAYSSPRDSSSSTNTSTKLDRPNNNKNVNIICDGCDEDIPHGTNFYRCSTGRCGDDIDNDNYDLCLACYDDDGLECPGVKIGRCGPMAKVRVLMQRSQYGGGDEYDYDGGGGGGHGLQGHKYAAGDDVVGVSRESLFGNGS